MSGSLKLNREDFRAAYQAETEAKINLDPQQIESPLVQMFSESGVQKGSGSRSLFMGDVEFINLDPNIVAPKTPASQNVTWKSRSNLQHKAHIDVVVPREISQKLAMTTEQAAARYREQVSYASLRSRQNMILRSFEAPTLTNTLVHGQADEANTAASEALPKAQVRIGSGDDGKFGIHDFDNTWLETASRLESGLSEKNVTMTGMDDMCFVTSSKGYRQIIRDNEKYFYNRDFRAMANDISKPYINLNLPSGVSKVIILPDQVLPAISVSSAGTLDGRTEMSFDSSGLFDVSGSDVTAGSYYKGFFTKASNLDVKKSMADYVDQEIYTDVDKSLTAHIYESTSLWTMRLYDELMWVMYWRAS